ncbi:MAG: SBBP repeat-containing protein [Candidatus Competibacteraceae bacterium]|nr:SBBP repeat-containing protein [Candidatus Competibacteraceae bacterium]
MTGDEAVLSLRPSRPTTEPAAAPMMPGAVIRTRLEGAALNPAPQIEGLEKLPGISNYLLGNDPTKWRTHVPHYQRVRYANVYPGIDLVYYGNPQQLEHDFIVAPGADPAMIQLAISGAERVRVNADGDLVLTVPGGEVVQQAPWIYQVIDGQQQTVAGRYVLRNSEAAATTVNIAVANPMLEPLRVGFEVAQYDRKQPLVIDPVLDLVYSTFLGGIKEDYGTGIAVDDSGYAWVTGGTTSSINFPTAGGGIGSNPPPTYIKQDAFVSKFDFNQTGAASLFCSTYLSGDDDKDDVGYAIAVDKNAVGFAFVTGTTASASFPITFSSPPSTLKGGKDAFIAMLDFNCQVLFSTYWGGAKDDEGRGIAVRSSKIYVTGYTSSNFTDGFPLKNPFQPALLGGTDAFVSVIDTGGTLYYSTYLGGAKDDKGAAIAVDDLGHIYITGSTASANFPVTGLAFDTILGGGLDGFIAKIDSTNIDPIQAGRYTLVYSSYLGGSSTDSGAAIAVDSGHHAYVTGSTASSDFPMTPNAAQSKYGGNGDAFVTKIDPDPTLTGMNSLFYSTYLGGNQADSGAGIVVIEPAGAIRTYITGATASPNFPVTAGAMDSTLGGSGDAFVAQISDTGKSWVYVTYLGGNNGIDSGAGIAANVTASGSNVYVTGATNANDFPTKDAFEPINHNDKDAFVVKLEDLSFSMNVTRVGSGTVKSTRREPVSR